MKNILNMCEYMRGNADWPDDFEGEDIVTFADDLSYYYIRAKSLEEYNKKLEAEIAQLRRDSEVLRAM